MQEKATRPGPAFGMLGWLIALLFLGLIFLIWAIGAAGAAPHLVPDPGKAFARLGTMLGEPAVRSALFATLASWGTAFAVGGTLGLAIGIPAGRTRIGSALLSPLMFVAATMPGALLALLFVLFEGIGGASAHIVSAIIAAFIPAAAVSARAQAGGTTDRLRGAFHALEAAAVAALTAVLLVEMVSSKDRIGMLAVTAFSTFDAPTMYALVLLVWLLGVAVALPFAIARWLAGRAG